MSSQDEKKKLASFLRKLADLVEDSSSQDFERIFADAGARSRGTLKGRTVSSGKKDWLQIADDLRKLETRDDGQKLLDKLSLSKAELEQLARVMNLPVPKQDTAQRLREKIVESAIGARLVSKAIRGA